MATPTSAALTPAKALTTLANDMTAAEERKRLRSTLAELRRQSVRVDGELVPGSIGYLLGCLSSASDAWARYRIWGDIRDEYARAGNWERQLEATRRAASELPDEPLPHVSLAECLAANGRTAEAKIAVERALALAEALGVFIRYTLSARARLARATHDAPLLADSLRRLIAVGIRQAQEEDASLEGDVVDGLSKFAGNTEIGQLASAYRRVVGEQIEFDRGSPKPDGGS